MNSKQTDPRAAEGEPKRMSEGELAVARHVRESIRPIPPEAIDKLLAHVAAQEAEIETLQQRDTEANGPEAVEDLGPKVILHKSHYEAILGRANEAEKKLEEFADVEWIGDWKSTGSRTWRLLQQLHPDEGLDLLQTAEAIAHGAEVNAQRILELEKQLAEATFQVANYLTYGQGGATFNEAQWIDKLAQSEQTRDAKIEELQQRLAALAEVKGGEALGRLAHGVFETGFPEHVRNEWENLDSPRREKWCSIAEAVAAHVRARAQCEARHAAELAAANERAAELEKRLEAAELHIVDSESRVEFALDGRGKWRQRSDALHAKLEAAEAKLAESEAGAEKRTSRLRSMVEKKLGAEVVERLIADADADVAEFAAAEKIIEKHGFVVLSDSFYELLADQLTKLERYERFVGEVRDAPNHPMPIKRLLFLLQDLDQPHPMKSEGKHCCGKMSAKECAESEPHPEARAER